MDPDYEVSDFVLEEANKRKDEAKTHKVEIIKTQIKDDFQKDLNRREEQLVDIENRITCLRKTLHILRYVLVSSYYNRKDLQLDLCEKDLKLVDPQKPIHPAVKKIIQDGAPLNLDTRKRKLRNKAVVLPIEESAISKPEVVLPTIQSNKEDATEIPRNRPMVKKRILVGNISKFMPTETREDNSTHKWMVYVRGPKESPRVDDFINKIVFYLHPSYKPHDVIEVKDHPFHLTRRGWGEFPIRVQLFFVNPLNKPIDVIHNLKLDKTYTGRQMLGNETVVDLTIYDENLAMSIKSEPQLEEYVENGCVQNAEFECIEDTRRIKEEIFEDVPMDIQEEEMINIDDSFLNPLTDHNYSLNL